MHEKRRFKVETQQEQTYVHKHNTCSVKFDPNTKNPQPLQLWISFVVPYKPMQVGFGYAKQIKPM
jgi:hypothetical protein